MRPIFINGRFLSQPVTGTQRYAHELLRSLDSLVGNLDLRIPLTVLVPASVKEVPTYENLRLSKVGKFSGQIWEQFELPFYVAKGVLFTPCGGAPILHRRNIITIHDAAVVSSPLGYSRTFRTWYRFLNRALCKSALHLFTVSNFSKSELVKQYKANPNQITVTYLGSEHAMRPVSEPSYLAKHQLRRLNYILLAGSRNPNKNLIGLLNAIPRLVDSGMQIAIAGHSDPKVFGKLHVPEDLVKDLGYVSDSELRTLYENAACFVFPSFYEGFGLPPLESLALGCPTVVANASALAEIFSEVAYMCDPHNPADIAKKILKACSSSEEKRSRSRDFAKNFKWEICAEKTLNMIIQFSQT